MNSIMRYKRQCPLDVSARVTLTSSSHHADRQQPPALKQDPHQQSSNDGKHFSNTVFLNEGL